MRAFLKRLSMCPICLAVPVSAVIVAGVLAAVKSGL